MLEPYLGQISLFAGNFAPRGWAFCDGSLLPIAQYSTLFSFIGTIYGGDGRTNFALPDLRGCAPVMFGQGPGLSDYPQGQKGGVPAVTLTAAQMATHTHAPLGSNNPGATTNPENAVWASSRRGQGSLYVDRLSTPPVSLPMSPQATGQVGGNQPHNNLPPYLALNYIIALQGNPPLPPARS